jgi:hypothetical protein
MTIYLVASLSILPLYDLRMSISILTSNIADPASARISRSVDNHCRKICGGCEVCGTIVYVSPQETRCTTTIEAECNDLPLEI